PRQTSRRQPAAGVGSIGDEGERRDGSSVVGSRGGGAPRRQLLDRLPAGALGKARERADRETKTDRPRGPGGARAAYSGIGPRANARDWLAVRVRLAPEQGRRHCGDSGLVSSET